MYQVIFSIAIAAAAGAALIAPLRSYSDQLSLSVAVENYINAVQLYRAYQCRTTPEMIANRVFDADLVAEGYLDAVHPQIRFVSEVTSAGIQQHFAAQNDRTGSNFGDLYRVTGGTENFTKDGFTVTIIDVKEYSQGQSPPGFAQLMYLDEIDLRCL